MGFLATNLVIVGEENIVDRVVDSKVNKVKIDTKIAKFKSQDKSKGKNLVKSFSI